MTYISGTTQHRAHIVLKVSRDVHREVPGGIRYTGQGLPKALIIRIKRYLALKSFQFPQQHHFDIARSIHASSIDTSSLTSIKYKSFPKSGAKKRNATFFQIRLALAVRDTGSFRVCAPGSADHV